MRSLPSVAYGCTFMTDEALYASTEGRAAQSRQGPAAAVGARRCGRTNDPRLFAVLAPSLPLCRAGAPAEEAGRGAAIQSDVYGQGAFERGPTSAPPSPENRIIAERNRQPSPASSAGWRMRDGRANRWGTRGSSAAGISFRSVVACQTATSLPIAGSRETLAGGRSADWPGTGEKA